MEIQEFVEQLTKWHKFQVQQLQTVLDHPDARIKFTHDEGDIELSEEQSKGFRAGVRMSLQRLGTLPFTVATTDGE